MLLKRKVNTDREAGKFAVTVSASALPKATASPILKHMRIAMIAVLLLSMPGVAVAGSGSRLGSSTAGGLDSPSYHEIGKTTSTRVTTIAPRKVIAPAGAIGTEPDDGTMLGSGRDEPLLLERRLDCFAGAVVPDRDSRNRFLSRCPGNTR